MINSTPKKDHPSRKINVKSAVRYTPSKLTIRLIMGYAAAIQVHNTEILGQINMLQN